MTGASKGLQKALARAGSSVLAIAEMQPKDLLAEMSDEQKAALATELAPYAVASDDAGLKPEDKAGEYGDYDVEGYIPEMGKDKKKKGSEASADASATARVKAVALAVATDDNCKGKADLALSMLADDDFNGLSASGLVKLLGKTPATTSTSASSGVDAEEAARAEMRSVIASTSNSNIDANAGGNPSGAVNHSAGWAKATARVNRLNGFGQ